MKTCSIWFLLASGRNRWVCRGRAVWGFRCSTWVQICSRSIPQRSVALLHPHLLNEARVSVSHYRAHRLRVGVCPRGAEDEYSSHDRNAPSLPSLGDPMLRSFKLYCALGTLALACGGSTDD